MYGNIVSSEHYHFVRLFGAITPRPNQCAVGGRPQKDESEEDEACRLLGTYGHSFDNDNSLYSRHPQ